MATLDADDLLAIRTVVQEEIAASTYIQRLDVNVSSTSGLSTTEHNQLMSLENTDAATATRAAKAAVAITAGNRRKR